MKQKILLIDHHDNPRDDLATSHLTQMGYEIELCYPFRGDKLPKSNDSFCGAVIYGGEQNVTELETYAFLKDEIKWIRSAVEEDFPTIGICLGAQLIAHVLGAEVGYHKDGLYEFGYYEITPTNNGQTYFPQSMFVTQAHYQHYTLPEGAVLLATGKTFPNQAYQYGSNIFGLQFHPEITAEILIRLIGKCLTSSKQNRTLRQSIVLIMSLSNEHTLRKISLSIVGWGDFVVTKFIQTILVITHFSTKHMSDQLCAEADTDGWKIFFNCATNPFDLVF